MDLETSPESGPVRSSETVVVVPVETGQEYSADGNSTNQNSEAVQLAPSTETQGVSKQGPVFTPNVSGDLAAGEPSENIAVVLPMSQKMRPEEESDMDAESGIHEMAENLPMSVSVQSVEEIRDQMLNRLANSDAHFKHQQREDPDLTHSEKLEIATKLLQKPSVFLSRFGKFLEAEDLHYFHSLQGDYIIDFHLKEIRERLNVHKNHVVVRNRRYEAMKQLIAAGEYFSDEELKYRDPLLYEQMVGQYLSDDEVAAQVNKCDMHFSTILIQNLQMIQNNEIYTAQKEQEASQMDESDQERASDLESDESELESDDDEKIPEKEKDLLRAEFLRTMQLRFLNGEDKDFNYSEVDNNVEYDSLDIRERDEQDKYFDEEEPEMSERDICDDMMEESKGTPCEDIPGTSTSKPDEARCPDENTISADVS